MQIDPNKKAGAIAGMAASSPAVRPMKEEGDQASFLRSEALNRALRDTPDVRPERVARARELIGDVQYPPRETITKISNLLAVHWQTGGVRSAES